MDYIDLTDLYSFEKEPSFEYLSTQVWYEGSKGSSLCYIWEFWEEEAIQAGWSKGIIVLFPKKGDTTLCNNDKI